MTTTFERHDPDSMLAAFRRSSARLDADATLDSARALLSWMLHDGPPPSGLSVTHAMSESYAGVKWAEREIEDSRRRAAASAEGNIPRRRPIDCGEEPRPC